MARLSLSELGLLLLLVLALVSIHPEANFHLDTHTHTHTGYAAGHVEPALTEQGLRVYFMKCKCHAKIMREHENLTQLGGEWEQKTARE